MLEKKTKCPINHKLALKERRRKNIDALLQEINTGKYSKYTLTKIKNEAEILDWSYNYLIYKLKTEGKFSDSFASKYCKSPNRQNIHENLMLEYINNLPVICNQKKYSTNGKDSLYIRDGKLTNTKNSISGTKSIDASFEYHFKDAVLKFYVSLKYTNENGGSQLEQEKDIINFIQESCKVVSMPDTLFYAITDGNFYYKPYKPSGSNVKYKHRMDYIEEKINNNNVYITNTDELFWRITDSIIQWLHQKEEDGLFSDKEIQTEIKRLNYFRDKMY